MDEEDVKRLLLIRSCIVSAIRQLELEAPLTKTSLHLGRCVEEIDYLIKQQKKPPPVVRLL